MAPQAFRQRIREVLIAENYERVHYSDMDAEHNYYEIWRKKGEKDVKLTWGDYKEPDNIASL